MNKKLVNILVPAIPVLAVLGSMLFSPSCANTTTPPSGGPKDTIPPVIVKIAPEPGMVNVPVKKTHLEFKFNEYVVVKDPKSLFLSPPLEKAPKYKIHNKSVIISFESPLDSNKTYSLDLTNAIADNNEGNMFPGFTLVFSTGPVIDSMMITGVVQDCNTLQPVKGATVMLYKDQRDSAVFLQRPDAAVKTDDWGFFCLRNIQDTVYRMFAVTDENHNNMYDPESERIAFIDTIIKPIVVVADSLPELAKYDMKDTLLCRARKTEFDLNLFKEKPSKQMIVNKERVGDRTAYITFMAPEAKIDSLWIQDVDPAKIITQFNIQKDSLEIWVNDPGSQPDTLHLYVNYLKTDTLGVLAPFTEHVKLSKPRQSKSKGKSNVRDVKKEDTTCVFTVDAKPENVEHDGFVVEFKYPIVQDALDSLAFWYLNPKRQESKAEYTVTQDSLNLRKYVIRPTAKLLAGYEYHLKFPHRKFVDINGFYNDSLEVKVSLPTDDKLSSISLDLKEVHNRYIVDLLNEKMTTVLKTFIVDKDQVILFPYLRAGKYAIRMTEDMNKNGIVDTGILLEGKQPEKVKFYKLSDGKSLIDVMEKMDMLQTVDVSELFK